MILMNFWLFAMCLAGLRVILIEHDWTELAEADELRTIT